MYDFENKFFVKKNNNEHLSIAFPLKVKMVAIRGRVLNVIQSWIACVIIILWG